MYCTVRCVIIICFSLLFSNHWTYVVQYSFHVCFLLYFCFPFCIFCVFEFFCVLIILLYIAVSFLLCTVYRPLPPGGHSTAVNKHIISYHIMSCHHDSCSERHQTNKCILPLFHSLYPLLQKWH